MKLRLVSSKTFILLLAWIMLVLPANARGLGACEIVQIFNGSNLLSKATMPGHGGFDGYDFLLVLNDQRDKSGILNSYIKGVLKPARWGFEVELPSGKRVGQVMLHVVDPKLPKGTVEVIVGEDTCEYGDSIFLKGSKGNERIVATYRRREIGIITNKYPEFWER